MTASNSNLVRKTLRDKNGVLTTRWVKADKAGTGVRPIPSPDQRRKVSAQEEQRALFDEVLPAMMEHGHPVFAKANAGLIRAMQEAGRDDYREVFRIILANIATDKSMGLIMDTTKALAERGVMHPHEIVDEDALHLAEMINGYSDDDFSDLVHCALTASDRDLTRTLIESRKPRTLNEFKSLQREFHRSTPPLQNGVL